MDYNNAMFNRLLSSYLQQNPTASFESLFPTSNDPLQQQKNDVEQTQTPTGNPFAVDPSYFQRVYASLQLQSANSVPTPSTPLTHLSDPSKVFKSLSRPPSGSMSTTSASLQSSMEEAVSDDEDYYNDQEDDEDEAYPIPPWDVRLSGNYPDYKQVLQHSADHDTKKITGKHKRRSANPTMKEEEKYVPIANINRIMKQGLPSKAKVARDAKETMQECVTQLITLLTTHAKVNCSKERRRTMNGEDILKALSKAGFHHYVQPLRAYMSDLKSQISNKRLKRLSTEERDAFMQITPPQSPYININQQQQQQQQPTTTISNQQQQQQPPFTATTNHYSFPISNTTTTTTTNYNNNNTITMATINPIPRSISADMFEAPVSELNDHSSHFNMNPSPFDSMNNNNQNSNVSDRAEFQTESQQSQQQQQQGEETESPNTKGNRRRPRIFMLPKEFHIPESENP